MIEAPPVSPRRTRLVRLPDLPRFHQAIALASLGGSPFQVRRCAVVVPSAGAADALRHTFEDLCLVQRWVPDERDRAALEVGEWDAHLSETITLPHLVTRSGLYDLLHERLEPRAPLLTPVERAILFEAAAARARDAGAPPPFEIRPALVASMIELYDAILRRLRTVDDFERLVGTPLEAGAAIDRGAERLLQQTRFLAATFRHYRQALAERGLVDEHGLRERLLDGAGPTPLLSIVVTVPDQAASPGGLWPADYDLLARLPALESLVVVATEGVLGAGYLPRLLDTLPEIDVVALEAAPRAAPVLLAPAATGEPVFVSRDREEEIAGFARRTRARDLPAAAEGAVALVYQRPLPYLYLARQAFRACGLTWQARDTLPLAAEPHAALLDLVLSFVTSGFAPSIGLELIETPAARVPNEATLASLSERLRPLTGPRAPSAQLALLAEVLGELESPPADPEALARHLRARGAVLELIEQLRGAFARFGDQPRTAVELAMLLRDLLEARTFNPRVGPGLVHLIDAQAAPYGHYADVTLVGLVEGEWPEPAARNVFFPAGLLRDLGWPSDGDRRAAARAAFDDLFRLPTRTLALSTFTLEDDGLVRVSPYLEDLDRAGLDTSAAAQGPPAPVLAVAARDAAGAAEADAWRALRAARSSPAAPAFRGATAPVPPRAYSVTSVDRYRQCPFKYFAQDVLRLEEEPDDEPGLTPLARGEFVHEVFREFFARWAAAGRRAIDAAALDDARALFAEVVDALLERLPESERALERARLLGSPVGAGLGERSFRFEASRPTPIVERLLEFPLSGEYSFAAAGRERRATIRGVADRIDLLADGTLRLLDYKTGKASNAKETLQVQVYGLCAERRLAGHGGRAWTVSDAGYLAFGRQEPFVSIVSDADREPVLAKASEAFVEAVDAIERGEFPVRPVDTFICSYCGFSAVCRKDYVDDE